jgi:hypothetical protein
LAFRPNGAALLKNNVSKVAVWRFRRPSDQGTARKADLTGRGREGHSYLIYIGIIIVG